MNVGSLFSGIGGIDLGLERAGMRVAWQCELDPWCRSILARHWPGVPCYADVRSIGADAPRVDVLAGGFPCQPVSLAGKGLAQADERWLWPEFARLVRVLRPRYVIAENVPGLLARGLDLVLADLAALGFDAEWTVFGARDVGAPHRRERVWIVAADRDRDGFEGRSEHDERAPGGIEASLGDDAFGLRSDLADADDGNGRARIARCESRLAPTSGQDPEWRGWAWPPEPDVGRVASRIPPGLDGELNAHAECIAQASAAGVPRTRRLQFLWEHEGAPATPPSRTRRCLLCGHPLSGLPCRGACRPWHLGERPEGHEDVRCLREGLLGLLAHAGQDLQSFVPVGTRPAQRSQTMGSRVDRLRALGNAVVPACAEHIGRLVMEMAQ